MAQLVLDIERATVERNTADNYAAHWDKWAVFCEE